MNPQELYDIDAPANMEVISKPGDTLGGSGFLTSRLLQSGGDVRRFASSLRTADLLRKDEWKRMDETVINVTRANLLVTQRLLSQGLSYNLPNALGVLQIDQERVGDMGPAEMQMTALVREETDRVDYDMTSLPIPIIHKGFNLNVRHLLASRNGSTPIDITQTAIAARKVAERIESLIINGDQGLNFGATAMGIPGMLTAPDAPGGVRENMLNYDLSEEGAISANNACLLKNSTLEDRAKTLVYEGWTAGGSEGEAVDDPNAYTFFRSRLTDVQSLFDDVVAQTSLMAQMNFSGPFTLYVPYSLAQLMVRDWTSHRGPLSVRSRILELENLSNIIVVPSLPNNKTVLIQETVDVVDIVNGIQPTTVSWSPDPGFITYFMVMAIIVPRFKSTKAKQTGVVIGTRRHDQA